MTILPRIGATISGTGIPAGTTVSAVDVTGATVTMSANATADSAPAGITVTIDNDILGSSANDQVERHTHQILRYDTVYYNNAWVYGYCWSYTASSLSTVGGTEVRPNNTNVMYIIRATAL
jgi:hypothetical protein